MVMDGDRRGTMALATPQQSGSTPFLVKYPHLQGNSEINSHFIPRPEQRRGSLFFFLSASLLLSSSHLDGVVRSVGDQQRLCVQEARRGHRRPVCVSLLSDHLAALQIPEGNVALRAP